MFSFSKFQERIKKTSLTAYEDSQNSIFSTVKPKKFKTKKKALQFLDQPWKMKSTDQDEDYLISRAKRNSQSDENGGNVKALSKSWLITARVMYPG